MGKMKRFFSLMLVLTIVLGSFSSVFAAEEVKTTASEELKKVPTDVVGTEYEKAVARLVAFGVLDGYKDGTYRPDQDVTRAEFAKILVEALGIGNAAKAAAGKVTFKDVPASHWASGYVSTASGYGLLVGFPDGTFKPEQQVSHADALTMLVRALGYQDSFLKGTWPGSHIAKAAEAGITSGVSFTDARGFANRGKVAQMVNNTLDCDVVKVETYKDGTVEYKETEKTLLKDKLDISKYEDTRVIADKVVDDGLAKDEVTVLFTKEIDKDDESVKKSYKKGETKDFTTRKGVNPRPLIGEEVSVYMNDRDEVVYIESEDDDRADFDYVDEITNKGTELSLVKFDKEYKFDDDAYVYVFNQDNDKYEDYRGKDLDKDKIEKLGLSGKIGKFVIKNNRIIFAEILDSTEAYPVFVVLENNKGVLEGINKETEDFKLDLTKDGTYDYALVYDIQGNEMNIEDIEKGNVLYVQMQDYDGDDVAVVRVVTDNKIEGKVGKFREDRVEIDGKFKNAINYVDASGNKWYDTYYTINTLEDIEQWNSTDWENDFDDAHDENAVVYLDAVGRIAFLHTGAESVSGYKFGVVTRTYADQDRVRIFTSLDGKDGEDIVFKADKERNISSPRYITYKNGKFDIEDKKKTESRDILGAAVKFRLNKDGEIAEDEFYVMDRSAVFAMDADFGKDSMRVAPFEVKNNDVNEGAKGSRVSFSIKDNVSIIDAEGLNPLDTGLTKAKQGDIEVESKAKVDVDDFGAVVWKDMKDTKKDDEIRFYVFPRKDKLEEVEGLVFVGNKGANTASDREAVYVRDRWRKGDDIVIEYITYGSDERKTAIADSATDISDIDRRYPYVAEERSNGKIKLLGEGKNTKNNDSVEDKDTHFRFIIGEVKEITGSRIEIKGGKTYTIDNKVVVYDGGDKRNSGNIKKGESVMMIVEDDIRVRVVKLDVSVSGGGTTPDEKLEGIVTYINDDDQTIEIDNDEIFEVKKTTKFVDKDGKTLAIGSAIVDQDNEKGVKEGDQVKTDTKTNTITLVKRKDTIDEDKALKEAKETLKAEIEKAEKLLAEAKEDYETKDEYKALDKKIEEAKVVLKDSKVKSEVETAKTDLVAKEDALKELMDKDEKAKENKVLAEKALKSVENEYKYESGKTLADLKADVKADAEYELTGAQRSKLVVKVTGDDPLVTGEYEVTVTYDGTSVEPIKVNVIVE